MLTAANHKDCKLCQRTGGGHAQTPPQSTDQPSNRLEDQPQRTPKSEICCVILQNSAFVCAHPHNNRVEGAALVVDLSETAFFYPHFQSGHQPRYALCVAQPERSPTTTQNPSRKQTLSRFHIEHNLMFGRGRHGVHESSH